MTEFIALLIIFVAMALIILIAVGITKLILHLLDRRRRKWCERVLKNYPELKVLLSEYCRLCNEYSDTISSIYKWRKNIEELIEKNKYLPLEKRVDERIENLKKYYCELLDIQAEYSIAVEVTKKNLIYFWETNFPELPEQKRIMWWDD